MPLEGESRDPVEWFKKGQGDIERVPRRLQENDCEDAAFHLQQAVEKYLKGFLIARGWPLRKTHNLSVLLDEAVKFLPELERYRSLCQQASALYVEERYPLFGEVPSRSELDQLFQQAQQLIGLLR